VRERERLSAARRDNLETRARVMQALRAFFEERDFLEVDTPLRVPSPGLEVHLTAVAAGDGAYLITSPEYQMKRLLAAGLPRLFTVCKCFRAGERGAHHGVEFTMLEWYRADGGLDRILTDVEDLVAACADAVGSACDASRPWQRVSVAEAMRRWAGVEVRGDETAAELRARVVAAGVDVGTASEWDDVFFCAWVERVDPAIAAHAGPLFVTDWPLPLAALARRRPDGAPVAERFEAYLGGLELANAFGELTDPVEQRRRFEADLAARRRRGRPEYPIDERLLGALAELPPCAGIALGVDRLVMALTGAEALRDVVAFAEDEL
jgi:lysyl-tRNA synthetase class 2